MIPPFFSLCSFIIADGSKCSFQLTYYLAVDIPPKSIRVDDVVPEQNVDRMTLMPESAIFLPGFRTNAFSVNQLLDIFCPVFNSA